MGALAAAGWLWLVPGGGQFALDRPLAGAAFAAGVTGLAAWGLAVEPRRAPGELNVPLVWAQQLYVMGWYDADRERVERMGGDGRRDPAPLALLARAPVSPAALSDPWVMGFAAAGGAAAWWLALRHRSGRSDAEALATGDVSAGAAPSRATFLGGRFRGTQVPWALGGYWIPLSWGAGVCEEALFRGSVQPALASRWGDGPALLATSAAFGLAHLTPPFGREAWAQAGFAAAAGSYLGWRWIADGYRLRGPVAAHVWFDILAGAGAYLADPRENPLGAAVELRW